MMLNRTCLAAAWVVIKAIELHEFSQIFHFNIDGQ